MASTRPSATQGGPLTLEGSSYVAVVLEGIVAVRWFADSNAETFPPLTRFIVDAARATGKLDMLAIVHPVQGVPDGPHREALTQFVTDTQNAVADTHVVFVGKGGFWQTIVRSIMTSLMMLLGKHRQLTVHDTLDAAVTAACRARRVDATAWYAAAAGPLGMVERGSHQSGRFSRPASASAERERRAARRG